MTVYKAGDWVTVRCLVKSTWVNDDRTDRAALLPEGTPSNSAFNIDAFLIRGKVEQPLPDEPERNLILRDQHGHLWTHVEQNRTWTEGWQRVGSSTRYYWSEQFYRDHGPFDLFSPGVKI